MNKKIDLQERLDFLDTKFEMESEAVQKADPLNVDGIFSASLRLNRQEVLSEIECLELQNECEYICEQFINDRVKSDNSGNSNWGGVSRDCGNSTYIGKLIEDGRNGVIPEIHISQIEAKAILRDLGILAAQFKVGSKERSLPQNVETLLQIAALVANEVPREHIYSYTLRNPSEPERIRTYTGSLEELLFVQKLKSGIVGIEQSVMALHNIFSLGNGVKEPHLDLGVNHLGDANLRDQDFRDVNLRDQDFRDANLRDQDFRDANLRDRDFRDAIPPDRLICELELIAEGYQAMIQSVAQSIREIPVDWFSRVYRPYFEPLIVGGEKYVAANGAQIPNFLIDIFFMNQDVLGKNSNNLISYEELMKYWENESKYLPSHLQQFYRELKNSTLRRSLQNQSENSSQSKGGLQNLLHTNNKSNPHLQANDEEERIQQLIEKIVTKVLTFRSAHLKLAQNHFQERESGSSGGGGYTLEMLQKLKQTTSVQRDSLLGK